VSSDESRPARCTSDDPAQKKVGKRNKMGVSSNSQFCSGRREEVRLLRSRMLALLSSKKRSDLCLRSFLSDHESCKYIVRLNRVLSSSQPRGDRSAVAPSERERERDSARVHEKESA